MIEAKKDAKSATRTYREFAPVIRRGGMSNDSAAFTFALQPSRLPRNTTFDIISKSTPEHLIKLWYINNL